MKYKGIFGTDGIRGRANTFPMTANIAMLVGQAMGYILKRDQKPNSSGKKQPQPMVLIGKDTRLSGYMIEQALSSGFNSMGVRVNLTGPLPTPGIGFLAQNMRADAGIVISASHNSFHDNGIKIFGKDGFKIPDSMEDEIEELISSDKLQSYLSEADEIGRTRRIDDASGRYIVYAKNTFPLDLTLDGIRLVLDCANGGGYKVAPAIFEELGAEVIIIGNTPNGFNINHKVGALHPDKASEAVLKYRADVGITIDGDADRVIMIDEKGRVVNGDHILTIMALHLKTLGRLKNNTVVATEMSNIGLNRVLKENDINVVRTGVGDKKVVEEMLKNNYVLGGEQSGHIICLEHSTTGDGCVAGLNVLAAMKASGKPLSELNDLMEDMPQVLINTRIQNKLDLDKIDGYSSLLAEANSRLGEFGRIFIRYSGTEPLVRVLVEGEDRQKITKIAEELADFLAKKLS